jgi:hypothetical protein
MAVWIGTMMQFANCWGFEMVYHDQISNTEFLVAIFPELQSHEHIAVCSKAGDPSLGGWSPQANRNKLPAANNNYFIASKFIKNGRFKVIKPNAISCHALILDDVGTRVPLDRLVLAPSWLLETSQGNYQAGYLIASSLTAEQADSLWQRFRNAGLTDPGASGPVTRWARLPQGVNGKPERSNADGSPFQCRLVEWKPEKRYTPTELCEAFGLPPWTEEDRKPSSVFFCASSVESYPASCIPHAVGQRNSCLFALARHFKSLEPQADSKRQREICKAWHDKFLAIIGTKGFAITWADFQHAWSKVKYTTPVLDGCLIVLPPVPDIDRLRDYGPEAMHLMQICMALANHHEPKPFFLACRKASELVGLSRYDAAKLLRLFVDEGWIQLVQHPFCNFPEH